MIGTGNWADGLEKVARKNFDIGTKELPDNREVLWDVVPSQKYTETMIELGDIAPMGQFTGTVNYTDISQGYKVTKTTVQYALGIKIERIFVDTDQQDIVSGLPKKLGIAARRRQAADSVFHLQNAFNTSITTIDGLQLCSTAHTSNNGGSNQSNQGTSALSATSVEATRRSMRRFLSNTDQTIDVQMDMIVCGLDTEEKAWEIIKSNGKVDTANNNRNFHEGRYKLLVDPRITGSKWFAVDSRLLKEYCTWYELTKLEFNQDKNFDDYSRKFSAYTAYSYIPRDWRWVYGHNA